MICITVLAIVWKERDGVTFLSIPDTEKNDWHIAGAQLIELNNYHLCAEDAVLGEANCYNKPLPDLNGLKDYSLLMPQFD